MGLLAYLSSPLPFHWLANLKVLRRSPLASIKGLQRPKSFLRAGIRFVVLLPMTLPGASSSATGTAPSSEVSERGVPLIRNFSAREFGGRPMLQAVNQASNGFIYFVNYNGVVIFDGQEWERIGVGENHILRATPVEDGSIYLSPNGDFGRLRKDASGEWAYESLVHDLDLPPEHPIVGQIWSITWWEDSLFLTVPEGILRYDPETRETLGFWPTQGFNLILIPRGGLHVWSSVQGILEWNGVAFEVLPNPPKDALAETMGSVGTLEGGGFIFAHINGNIFRWHPGQPAEKLHHEAYDLVTQNGTILRVAIPLDDGGWALTTTGNGIVFLNEDGSVRKHLHAGNGLGNNNISSGRVDAQGNLWVTHIGGASVIDLDRRMTDFSHTHGLEQPVPDTLIRHNGQLLGRTDEGFYEFQATSTGGRWVKHEIDNNEVKFFFPWDDTLYVVRAKSYGKWDGENLIDFGPLPSTGITWAEADGRFFIGCHWHLLELPTNPAEWEGAELKPIEGISGPTLRIAGVSPGRILISNMVMGPVAIDLTGESPEIRRLGPEEGLPASGLPLSAHSHKDLLMRMDNRLFRTAGDLTFSEIALPKINGHAITTLEMVAPPPPGEDVFFIQARIDNPTKDPHLGWFRAVEGETPVWNPLPNRLIQLLGPLGALDVYTDPAPAEGDNILWLIGPEKLIRFEMDEPIPPQSSPRTAIKGIFQGENFFDHPNPTLAYKTEPIRIRFSSPDLKLGSTTLFQTRLDGFDANWSTPRSDLREVQFTNLIGGPFVFEVRAIDADGLIGPTASYRFSVRPPWYRSGLAWFFYALAATTTIFLYLQWRLSRSERERLRLEGLVSERTADLAAARDEAQRASEAKSSFLANMSHELRTPLNGIIGFAQILKRAPDLNEKHRRQAATIDSSGQHLLSLVNEVLDLSKIEAGRLELRVVPFDLSALLKQLATTAEARAEAKTLRFHPRFDAALPSSALGDEVKLRQVLENLLSNAIKFTPQGEITFYVSSVVGGRQIEFAVADTGPGLTPEEQSKIFEPFSQAGKASERAQGTGLGLPISRRLVELMGGELTVTSTPEHGSRFGFTIPLEELALETHPVNRAQEVIGYDGPPRRILIVDDVPLNREVLREHLEPLGLTCDLASDGPSALAHLAQKPYAAVLLDLRMPGMDGYEVARRLRALPSEAARTPVIAMSASILSSDQSTALQAGCDEFLAKPFLADDLYHLLARRAHLRWNYAEAASPPVLDESAALRREQLEPLHQAMQKGDIADLQNQLARLATSHPSPLVKAMKEAADNFQLSKLRHLIQAALDTPTLR